MIHLRMSLHTAISGIQIFLAMKMTDLVHNDKTLHGKCEQIYVKKDLNV